MIGFFRTPGRMEDLALFTRHLAGAMNARVPLTDMLRAYARDCGERSALATAITKMADRVESGVELSTAMEEYPKIFPAAYRRLVRLGEQSKTLGGVMTQMADSLEEGLKTYEYFRRAAIYPMLVMVLLFVDVCFLLFTITPRFQAIFDELGFSFGGFLNPVSTLSSMIPIFALLLLVPIGLLIGAVTGLRFRGFGYGRLALQMPLVGPVLRRAETARFANNLALLIQNRIPLAESLGLMADASENSYVRAAVQDFHRRFEAGEKLSDLIAAQPLFPAGMAMMISAAEDQGGLADTLRSLGRFYSERTSHGLAVLREVFEPLMLLLIGLLVALILLSIYWPLFQFPKFVS